MKGRRRSRLQGLERDLAEIEARAAACGFDAAGKVTEAELILVAELGSDVALRRAGLRAPRFDPAPTVARFAVLQALTNERGEPWRQRVARLLEAMRPVPYLVDADTLRALKPLAEALGE